MFVHHHGRWALKYFNWLALDKVSLGDAIVFLLWLEAVPSGSVNFAEVRDAGPLKTGKLPDLIKVLTHFGLVARDQNQVSITNEGRRFAWSGIDLRLATLRTFFLQGEPGRKVLALLSESESGRLGVKKIISLFQEIYGFYISPTEVHGFLDWGAQCRLFDFAKDTYEVARIETELPNGNRRPTSPPEQSA